MLCRVDRWQMGGMSLLVRSRADALGLTAHGTAVSDAPVIVRAKMEYQGHRAEDAEAFSPRELLRWSTELLLRPGTLLAVCAHFIDAHLPSWRTRATAQGLQSLTSAGPESACARYAGQPARKPAVCALNQSVYLLSRLSTTAAGLQVGHVEAQTGTLLRTTLLSQQELQPIAGQVTMPHALGSLLGRLLGHLTRLAPGRYLLTHAVRAGQIGCWRTASAPNATEVCPFVHFVSRSAQSCAVSAGTSGASHALGSREVPADARCARWSAAGALPVLIQMRSRCVNVFAAEAWLI